MTPIRPAVLALLAPVPAIGVAGCGDEDGSLEVTVLADLQAGPHSLAIDDTHVYWSGSRTLSSVRKDGTNLTVLTMTDSARGSMALDDGNVYWTQTGPDGAVFAIPKQGGDPVALADQPWAQDIAVDDSHVYWIAGQDVLSVPKGGGASTLLATGAWNGMNVAVDDSRVYVLNWCGCTTGQGELIAVPKEGGSAQQLDSQWGWWPGTLAVDTSHVYWRGFSSQIKRAPKDGEPIEVILESETGFRVIALDAGDVYAVREVADGDLETTLMEIVRVPKVGGVAQPVGTVDHSITSLAVDDTRLYWIDASEDRIMVADKPERP